MIKKVNEIPKFNNKPIVDVSPNPYRQMLRADIKEAYISGIDKFELVGYDIKPDYIYNAAKDEAFNVCREIIYVPAQQYVMKKLKKEFKKDLIKLAVPRKYSFTNTIRIRGITLADGVKHIFCEIDFDRAEKYKEILYQDSKVLTLRFADRLSRRKEVV